MSDVPIENKVLKGTENKSPLVTVVIPTHNRDNLISNAVQSVLHQTFNDLEILVVDDASQDNTTNVLNKMSQEDDRVCYIRNETPLGGGGARNIGIKNARGKYIAFLDDDDKWLPHKLERQLPYVEQYSIVGCLTTYKENRKLIGLNINKKQQDVYSQDETSITEITLYDIFYNNGRLSPTQVLTRRDYLLEIEGFDESLTGAQGRDLFVRLVLFYGPGLMLEEVLTVHDQAHGQNRISESSKHLEGYWKEFNKHAKYMPRCLRRWRKYVLCLREAKKARFFNKTIWLAQAFLNINPFWPIRSAKRLLITFTVK